MNMIKPSQDEKERAIEYILSIGLSKPKSLWKHFYELYRALGFHYLFLNTMLPVIISVALMIGFIVLCPLPSEQFKNAVLFATAPVFFIFVVLLTEIVERSSPLYELKMTCKYTIQQITAFRVLCFSLMGSVFCTLTSLFSRFPDVLDFFRALSLSLFALFICSFLSIFLMRYFNWKWTHFTPVLLWMMIGLFPIWILRERWESFLSQLPIVITVFFTVIAFGLYLMELKKLINIQQREVAYYVGR